MVKIINLDFKNVLVFNTAISKVNPEYMIKKGQLSGPRSKFKN